METSDPVKDKSNDTVVFFIQRKMEYFTKYLLTVLELVSLKLGGHRVTLNVISKFTL